MYPNSEDPGTPQPEPRPALALVAAAVERALEYVVDGRITLATIEADKTRTGHLITADLNPSTGKRAVASVAFSEELWGNDVQDYLSSIQKLRKSDLARIITEARKFSRVTRTHEEEDVPIRQGAQSARARIPLNYDSEDDEDEDADEDTEYINVDEQENPQAGKRDRYDDGDDDDGQAFSGYENGDEEDGRDEMQVCIYSN